MGNCFKKEGDVQSNTVQIPKSKNMITSEDVLNSAKICQRFCILLIGEKSKIAKIMGSETEVKHCRL